MTADDWAVDVVIPVRNGARYIGYCLDSVITQTRPPRAVIVVDDGSTDDTAAIVEAYQAGWSALRLIRTGKRGASPARNTGIQACGAPFVAFLDSDDLWAPDKLERQMRLFSTSSSRVGLVHSSYYHIDEHGRPVERCHIIEPKKRKDLLRDLLVEGNVISGSASAAVVRRDLLERTGGFDERLVYGEDWDLWLRLAEIAEFDFVPKALVAIRLNNRSTQRRQSSEREEQFLLQSLLVIDRWYGRPNFPQRLRRDYRQKIANLAVDPCYQHPFRFRHQHELFRRVNSSPARFGRELFSGPTDFFVALVPPYLLWVYRRCRRMLATGLRSTLGPERYQVLRDAFRPTGVASR